MSKEKIKRIEKSITQKQRELDILREEKARIEYLPELYPLAEYLHSTFCSNNHTDECSWIHEQSSEVDEWDKAIAHTVWLGKVIDIIRFMFENGLDVSEIVDGLE